MSEVAKILMRPAKKRQIKIGDRVISDYSDCFVIAEIGHNHQGDLDTARAMFRAAKECGVDAVKLQKRHNRSLYTRRFFDSPYESENSFGQTYGLHRQALEFSKREYQSLKKYAQKLGLIFFATPFDVKSVDFLEEIDIPCYKIASADIHNTPLLVRVAKTGKPVIISTGTSTIEGVERAFKTVWPVNKSVAFMQSTAVYPTDPQQMDLRVIETFRKRFPTVVGLSDHYNGIALDVAAYLLGARIIEKHFTLNRAMKGTDHAFSLEPEGMRKMVRDLKRTVAALGDGVKKFYEEEKAALHKMGKSIVAARNLPQGHVLTLGDLAFKSPGDGLLPYNADRFLGKRLKLALRRDQALEFTHV